MHLFEFMDQTWLPSGIRLTLRDILECGNSRPFRSYYESVAIAALQVARRFSCRRIVELGAGTGPITRHLVKYNNERDVKCVICDANPDLTAYEALRELHQDQIEFVDTPVDFAIPQEWPEDSLLLLSATLHHVPSQQRIGVLRTLLASRNPVLVAEPLRNSLISLIYTFLSLFPAILTPLRFWNRPGRLRRFLWCWLLPIAPILFIWDGIVSCFRQWRSAQWRQTAKLLDAAVDLSESTHTQIVIINKAGPRLSLGPVDVDPAGDRIVDGASLSELFSTA